MRTNHQTRFLFVMFLTLFIAGAAGCRSIGPGTLDRDQLDYGQSIGENWKNQMLANIVKIRFADMPVFVDVGSIVSGYSLETQVSASAGFGSSFTGEDTQGLGAGGRFTDRPTITYIPKTGDDYLRSLLTPVSPRNLMALIQTGYNAEVLFTWAVEAVNDISNYAAGSKDKLQADPEFYELTRLMREMQVEGVVAWEFTTDSDTGDDILLIIRRDKLEPGLEVKRNRINELLRLDGSLDRYRVVYAPIHVGESALALQTRSIAQMLSALSGFVDIPSEQSNQTSPGITVSAGMQRPFRVRSGKEKPDQTYAAIKYNGYWYWIDNTDLVSKRVFILMLFLTTLTNRSESGRGPVLTIPTG
jgi:hypothetical protein